MEPLPSPSFSKAGESLHGSSQGGICDDAESKPLPAPHEAQQEPFVSAHPPHDVDAGIGGKIRKGQLDFTSITAGKTVIEGHRTLRPVFHGKGRDIHSFKEDPAILGAQDLFGLIGPQGKGTGGEFFMKGRDFFRNQRKGKDIIQFG